MPRLFVDIEARFAQFQDALDKVERNTSRTAKSMETAFSSVQRVLGAIGVTLSTAAFAKFTLDIFKANAALVDMAEQTGASVENLSKLRAIAQLGGGDFEGLVSQLGLMVKGLKSGSEESQKAGAAFRFLGVAAKSADGSFRDTADIVTDVAKALSKYADDGNKVALVQDALGKGAERFIPYLKDIVKFGDEYGRVTAEQAKAAKEFETNLNRIKLAAEDSHRVIANFLFPTLSKLIEQMSEGSRIAGGFGSALRLFGLSMAPVGENGFGKRIQEYQDELEKLQSSHGTALGSGDTLDYAPQIADLKKQIEFMKYLQRQGALEGRTGSQFQDARDLQATPAVNPSSRYQSPDLSAAKRELTLYTHAMQQLEEELGKLQDLSKAEIVINRVTSGSWKDLTQEHKAFLISVAGEYDDRKRLLDVQKMSVENWEHEISAVRIGKTALVEFNEARHAEIDDLRYRQSLIGLSARDTEKLNAERQIEIDMRRQLAALPRDDEGEILPGAAGAMAGIITRADEQKRAVRGMIEDRQKAERDWLVGAKDAFNEYIDAAGNAARQSHDAITNAFRGAEEALVQFVKTGKLDFRSFADSVISDLARIAIQRNITGPIAQGFLSYFGGGEQPVQVGGPRAGGGPVSGGTAYLVGERGPEIFVPGSSGNVLPNGWGGGEMNVSVNVVNQGAPKDVTAVPRRSPDGVVLDLLLRDLRTSGAGRDQLREYIGR